LENPEDLADDEKCDAATLRRIMRMNLMSFERMGRGGTAKRKRGAKWRFDEKVTDLSRTIGRMKREVRTMLWKVKRDDLDGIWRRRWTKDGDDEKKWNKFGSEMRSRVASLIAGI
jgi:hypothetical protein